MRFRLILLTFACALAFALVPLSASAEPRMLVGFQDDPSLRWRDDRQDIFDVAEKANAGIVRIVFGEFYRDPRIFEYAARLSIELVGLSGDSPVDRSTASAS